MIGISILRPPSVQETSTSRASITSGPGASATSSNPYERLARLLPPTTTSTRNLQKRKKCAGKAMKGEKNSRLGVRYGTAQAIECQDNRGLGKFPQHRHRKAV